MIDKYVVRRIPSNVLMMTIVEDFKNKAGLEAVSVEFNDGAATVLVKRYEGPVVTSRSAGGKGNYTMGMKEQIIFPEIDYDKIDGLRGLDITLTTARTDDEGR